MSLQSTKSVLDAHVPFMEPFGCERAEVDIPDIIVNLFQFDCADLDFGVYRIMNRRRDVIEQFIAQDLPKSVAKKLDRGAPV